MMEAGLEEEEPSILVIVIDADPTSWQHIHGTSTLPAALFPTLPTRGQSAGMSETLAIGAQTISFSL